MGLVVPVQQQKDDQPAAALAAWAGDGGGEGAHDLPSLRRPLLPRPEAQGAQAEAAEKEPHPRSHGDVAELERKENAHGTRGEIKSGSTSRNDHPSGDYNRSVAVVWRLCGESSELPTTLL